METVIQKCTEIGAVGFIPFLSERTIVQYDERKESKRLDRWRKICKEAAEQAHRNIVPAVGSPLSLSSCYRLLVSMMLFISVMKKKKACSFAAVLPLGYPRFHRRLVGRY